MFHNIKINSASHVRWLSKETMLTEIGQVVFVEEDIDMRFFRKVFSNPHHVLAALILSFLRRKHVIMT